jgi:hypothetical protein
MEFVVPALVVLLLVAGAVTFFVLTVTRKSDSNAQDGGTPSFGRDPTPLGDTAEHSGEQSADGETVTSTDARGRAGGTGRATSGSASTGAIGARVADAEPAPATESERLANREP